MSAQIISLEGYRGLTEQTSLKHRSSKERPIISQEIAKIFSRSSERAHTVLSYTKGQQMRNLALGDSDLIVLGIQSRIHSAKLYEMRREVGEVVGYEHVARTIDYWERESQGSIKMNFRRREDAIGRYEKLQSHILFHLEKCEEWELETLLCRISEADLEKAPGFIQDQKEALVEEIYNLLGKSHPSH